MVTFKCTNENCVNSNVEYNFLGEIALADCGGCSAQLQSFDLRDDPAPIEMEASE
jgi:hypothetical protein